MRLTISVSRAFDVAKFSRANPWPGAPKTPLAEGYLGPLQKEVRRLFQFQGRAVEPGQIGCLRYCAAYLGQILGQQIAEQSAIAVQVGDDLGTPGIPRGKGRRVGYHAQNARSAGLQKVKAPPWLDIRFARQEQLRALESRQIPALGRGKDGDRVRGGRLRYRGVRYVGCARRNQRCVKFVGDDAGAVFLNHLGQRGQFLGGKDSAKRVMRVAEDHRAGPGAEGGIDTVLVDGRAPYLADHRHLDYLPPRHPGHLEKRRIRWCHDHYGTVRSRERLNGQPNAAQCIRDKADPTGVHRESSIAL